MKPETIVETLADGLEASVDGRGLDAKHQRAMNIANAGPAMLAALINLLERDLVRVDAYGYGDHVDEMLEAIASARGEEVTDAEEYLKKIRKGLARNDTPSDFDKEE
jgi:hypothetical protein